MQYFISYYRASSLPPWLGIEEKADALGWCMIRQTLAGREQRYYKMHYLYYKMHYLGRHGCCTWIFRDIWYIKQRRFTLPYKYMIYGTFYTALHIFTLPYINRTFYTALYIWYIMRRCKTGRARRASLILWYKGDAQIAQYKFTSYHNMIWTIIIW